MTRALAEAIRVSCAFRRMPGIDGGLDRDLEDRVTELVGQVAPRVRIVEAEDRGQANNFAVLRRGRIWAARRARFSSWSRLRACTVPTESISPSRTT